MEILIFLAIFGNIALSVVMFTEVEHLIDNQSEIWKTIQQISRRQILRKGKK